MDNWVIRHDVDLRDPYTVYNKRHVPVYGGDSNAHRWEVRISGEEAPDLDGYTLVAYFVRYDNVSVAAAVTRSDDGYTLSTVLPAEAYLVNGPMRGVIRAQSDDSLITLAEQSFTVKDASTEVVIDPTQILPGSAEYQEALRTIDTLTSTVNTLSTTVSSYRSTVTGLESDLSTLSAKLAQLQTDYDERGNIDLSNLRVRFQDLPDVYISKTEPTVSNGGVLWVRASLE